MKKLVLAMAAMLIAPSAFALELRDVVGTYRITQPGNPVSYTARIDGIGALYLTARSNQGTLECRGVAQMSMNVLSSALSCDDGRAFEHRIYFQGVRVRSPVFQARVYSSADRRTRLMNFRRLR